MRRGGIHLFATRVKHKTDIKWIRLTTLFVTSFQFLSNWRSAPKKTPNTLTCPPVVLQCHSMASSSFSRGPTANQLICRRWFWASANDDSCSFRFVSNITILETCNSMTGTSSRYSDTDRLCSCSATVARVSMRIREAVVGSPDGPSGQCQTVLISLTTEQVLLYIAGIQPLTTVQNLLGY